MAQKLRGDGTIRLTARMPAQLAARVQREAIERGLTKLKPRREGLERDLASLRRVASIVKQDRLSERRIIPAALAQVEREREAIRKQAAKRAEAEAQEFAALEHLLAHVDDDRLIAPRDPGARAELVAAIVDLGWCQPGPAGATEWAGTVG
jgi:hypothetical protein